MGGLKVTILGCGASVGVPVIGCGCATCTSSNSKNKRQRVSILVEYNDGTRILVDTSPDLRQQALAAGIGTIDGVIYTHAHADHAHGIDDVRMFNTNCGCEIDAYGTEETLAELKHRFPYAWRKQEAVYYSCAALTGHVLRAGEAVRLKEKSVQTFEQTHGKGTTLGLRFGDIVYSTDVNAFPPESEKDLRDMKVWIVDCLRDGEAGSHANLEMALGWIEKYKPQLAILTHMNHELEYKALKERLPENVVPAFDGMSIQIEADGLVNISE